MLFLFENTHFDGIINVDVKPFTLYRNDEEKHLCPVRAFLHWLKWRGPTPGPMFLSDRQGVLSTGKRLSYSSFKNRYEIELREIGVWNWNLYGTHSFRRGGCQFYLHVRQKSLRDIYAWGDWSNHSVAMRYMIGPNDDVGNSRQEFTRPPKTSICSECRRRNIQ